MAKTRSIEERIRDISSKVPRVAALIFGRGGTGKTTLLRTMPGKGLILDVPQVEGGTFVLSKYRKRIKVLPITKWAQLEEACEYLQEGKHDFEWVAVDTMSAMQKLAKKKTVRERGLAADRRIMGIQDWGKIGDLMGELGYELMSTKLSVILLAQERLRDSGEEDGSQEFVPDMSPMSLSEIAPPMFLVGRLYTRLVTNDEGESVVERRLRIGPHHSAQTKVRALPSRPLPPVLKEPNLGQIFAYTLGQSKDKPEAADEDSDAFEIIEE